jgi:hypothetical protein
MNRLHESVLSTLNSLLADAVLFYVLQVGLLAFVLIAWFLNRTEFNGAGLGSTTLRVTRGEQSMGHFYTMYGAISGLLIAISLSVEVAKDHRVFWVLFDAGLVAYVCLYNPWFRNRLIGWADRLAKLERR